MVSPSPFHGIDTVALILGRTVAELSPTAQLIMIGPRKRRRLDPVVERMITQSNDEHRERTEQRQRHNKELMDLQKEMMRQVQEELLANRQVLLQALELSNRTVAYLIVFLEKLSYAMAHQLRNSRTAPNVQEVQRLRAEEPNLAELPPTLNLAGESMASQVLHDRDVQP